MLLPDGDGIDFLTELRASPAGAAMPILMLSTEAEVKDRIRGLKTGADEYVGKPYDAKYVVGRARASCCASSGGRQPIRPTILVIDDSLTFRESAERGARGAGYRVLTARAARRACRPSPTGGRAPSSSTACCRAWMARR